MMTSRENDLYSETKGISIIFFDMDSLKKISATAFTSLTLK